MGYSLIHKSATVHNFTPCDQALNCLSRKIYDHQQGKKRWIYHIIQMSSAFTHAADLGLQCPAYCLIHLFEPLHAITVSATHKETKKVFICTLLVIPKLAWAIPKMIFFGFNTVLKIIWALSFNPIFNILYGFKQTERYFIIQLIRTVIDEKYVQDPNNIPTINQQREVLGMTPRKVSNMFKLHLPVIVQETFRSKVDLANWNSISKEDRLNRLVQMYNISIPENKGYLNSQLRSLARDLSPFLHARRVITEEMIPGIFWNILRGVCRK